ncbi:flagellar filament capping protein FliD [Romboutsia lituseburensis]|uniref:Flagellar hook-associated protein 2 n=1 Tax=Romboutsia lituseburensis DSM 797 TaxID=1121325 RepID=A0A1G9P8V8_9FIRM|nr:flagellar filament capping protein FliD [Romboutsia lituseburensis]CEH33290.1 Flagellar hook-associated protein 2 [Romboutsia lituseburensis]SDL95226.1 flagellar hook-associated protein 2 [Romboutsia lituseburensis DSM 797]
MSSVSGIRLPGLATGMDTDSTIKEMLKGEQNKIDKVKQKEQTIKWQQEIYREVIKDIQTLNDKYFSLTSKDSIVSSGSWNTLTVSSSNSNIITATGSAGANPVNYKFEVNKLASAGKGSSSTATNGKTIKKESSLEDLGLAGETIFKIKYGDGEGEISKSITIRTEPVMEKVLVDKVDVDGNPVKDADGNIIKEEKEVVKEAADTIDSLMKKINDATNGEVKASYSEMTGTFTLEGKKTGSSNGFMIVGDDGKTTSSSLDFLNLSGKDLNGKFTGTDSDIKIYGSDGNEIKDAPIDKNSNSFTIDGITYNLHSAKPGEVVELTSKQDVQPVIDNMKAFVEDYNKLMDKMYNLVTQKTNKDYSPLTEAQKEDMSEAEIERWEKKAKEGLLRNDQEMRKFIDDMTNSIFGDNMQALNEMGLTSHEDYNKKGQISLNEDKFRKSLETNADKVYDMFAKGSSSVMEKMKSTIKGYVGNSSSIFAKKAGIEKTASVANNFYSEQLKRQAETLKTLQRKMGDKENALYKKFSALEASMNKLNSQMSYFMQG